MMNSLTPVLALLLFAVAAARGAAPTVDPARKSYAPVSGVSGNLNSIGSDTLNNLMTYWGEQFHKQYPTVNIQVEGKGSATAPPALTAGTAQLGPMSRAMKPEEEEAFEKKHGCKPARISVALDCLAVFVHKDNPVKSLTMEQIDCLFSKTRKSGGAAVATWGDLGLTGAWANLPVSLYGRNSASGTYAFFKEHALRKGDYKDTVKEQADAGPYPGATPRCRAYDPVGAAAQEPAEPGRGWDATPGSHDQRAPPGVAGRTVGAAARRSVGAG